MTTKKVEAIKVAEKNVVDDSDFQRRAKVFLVDLNIIQQKHNVVIRPIITQYGPDIQINDAIKTNETKNELNKVV